MTINVDEIAPLTSELLALAERRCAEVVATWGRLQSVTMLNDGHGGQKPLAPSIRDLALACYAQGVRDTAAVEAALRAGKEGN